MNTSMSANNNNNASDTTMMRLSQFVSSLGSTWTAKDEEPSLPCVQQSVNVRTVALPSLCMDLEDDHRQQHQHGRSLQSQISDLMSRKVHMQADTAQERALPSRYMLENVLTSFEDLVEARIRAYGQLLSNHVHGLREAQQQGAAAAAFLSASSALLASNPQSSHNARSALIADSKLRTFLDIATKDAVFTSITTKFEVLQEISEDDGDDDATTSTTSTSTMNDEDERTNNHSVSLPIEMTVEITSENLPLQQQQYHGHHKQEQQKKDETTARTTQKKSVIFKIQGRIQGTSRSRKQKYCRVVMFVQIPRELYYEGSGVSSLFLRLYFSRLSIGSTFDI